MPDELDPKRPKFYLGQIVLVKPRPSQQPEATYAPVKITKVFEGSDGPAFVVKMLPDAEVEAIRQAEIKALRKLEKRAEQLEGQEARDAGRAAAATGDEPPAAAQPEDAEPGRAEPAGDGAAAVQPAGDAGEHAIDTRDADALAPPPPEPVPSREAPPQAPAPSRAKKGST